MIIAGDYGYHIGITIVGDPGEGDLNALFRHRITGTTLEYPIEDAQVTVDEPFTAGPWQLQVVATDDERRRSSKPVTFLVGHTIHTPSDD